MLNGNDEKLQSEIEDDATVFLAEMEPLDQNLAKIFPPSENGTKKLAMNPEQEFRRQRRNSLETMLGCGCYQSLHFLLCHLVTIGYSFNVTMMAFGKVKPTTWRCLDYSNQTSNFTTCEDFDRIGCKNLEMETVFESVVSEVKIFQFLRVYTH